MITTRQLQDEIIRLKKENDICILAHAYQSHDILEVADYTAPGRKMLSKKPDLDSTAGRAALCLFSQRKKCGKIEKISESQETL